MKNSIAFFDFDGTITTHDTLLEVIKFHKGSFSFYLGFIINAPYLLAYKAGIISNQTAKEKVLRYFFGGMQLPAFQQQCDAFANTSMPSFIRPKALEEIDRLKNAGTAIVIVTASAENWLQPWCTANGLMLLGTKLAVENGRLTGKISGLNCYGEEKVIRINAGFDLSQYDEIFCYGDTKGDKPMLQLATFSFYKPFR